MDSSSYPTSRPSQPARRPDIKKKLVVVGDGVYLYICQMLSKLSDVRLSRWLRQNMFAHCIRGEPLSRGAICLSPLDSSNKYILGICPYRL